MPGDRSDWREFALLMIEAGWCPETMTWLRPSGWCTDCQVWWRAEGGTPANTVVVRYPLPGVREPEP